ncbi:MAG: UDP-2,3-diacylglucosamine diphosphatase LpxI [Dialister sp.]|nr:UDP-2,3-diacylglucosamine diphosphatase LpxI [Dialister sp.]
MENVGLLAGIGTLPGEFLDAAHLQGYRVICIAVIPGTDPELKEKADVYYEINAFKLNKIIKTLVKENVKEVTLLGKVTKEWLYKDHVMPDLRAIKLLNHLRKQSFKDDTITLAIVDELKKDGISVLDQTKYLKPLMPGPQVFTKKQPTKDQWEDIKFGFDAAKTIGAMDLGQTVVVKDRAVMAVEAIEGTDACIKRGGLLAREGAVVVKTAKPGQDSRFDVPAIGLTTLRSMLESKCTVLAIEAHRTLFAEKEKVLEMAEREGIVILAVEQESL